MEKPIVYVAMSADLIHVGHLNIIQQAQKYGEVIVGVLTDQAISSYKRLPFLPWNHRKEIIANIKGVSQVIPQDSLDYVPNLEKIKPHFVIHGDDWRSGIQKETRNRVIQKLKEWQGTLIEIPYTQGISSTQIHAILKEIGTTPEIRQQRLKRLLNSKPILKFMEAHNGLSGLIVEQSHIKKNNKLEEFDGIWLSSLTTATAKGKPDIEYVDITARTQSLQDILEVTTKPLLFDADTGGLPEHFAFMVKTLERLGVSGVVIEDKCGLKQNSLFQSTSNQTQASINEFSDKIKIGKNALTNHHFMIFARIESLILQQGIDDALERAQAYIQAGCDGILIHSKSKTHDEIAEFCHHYASFTPKVPLAVVPTTYSYITESELEALGVNIVIYANHLIRSAYPAMQQTAIQILLNGQSQSVSSQCMPISEIINLFSIPKIPNSHSNLLENAQASC